MAGPRSQDAGPESRLVVNTAVQILPPAVRALAGLATVGVLARYLGVEGFGQYGLAIAFASVFAGVFGDWGLGTISLREISRRPEDREQILRSAASLQLGIAAASYLSMVTVVLLTSYPPAVKVGVAIFGLSLLFSPIDLLALPFQAELRVARVVGAGILGPVVGLGLTLGAIALHGSVVLVLAASTAALTIQYSVIVLVTLRFHPLSRGPLATHWKSLLGSSWPLGASTVFSTLQQQLPLLALSALSLSAVGLYSAAAKVPLQLVLVPLIVRNSTFPLLSHSWASDRERFTDQLARLMKVASIVAVSVGLLGVGMAPLIVRTLFGSRFENAAPAFAWLIVMVAALIPGILVGEAMIAAGYQRANMIVQATALPLLGGLLLLLVPTRGVTGAAAAATITVVAVVLAEFAVAARVLGAREPARWSARALLALLVGVVVLTVAGPLGIAGVVASGLLTLGLGASLESATVAWLLRRTVHARAPGVAATRAS